MSCDGLYLFLRQGGHTSLIVKYGEVHPSFSEQEEPIITDPVSEEDDSTDETAIASSQDEFVTVLEFILGSPRTNVILHSLIARTNDMGLEPVGR